MARSNRLLLLLLIDGFAAQAMANDVLPRLFTNVPVDTSFLSLSYTRSEGSVAVDPSIALDVDAELDTYLVSYSRSFAAWGQSAVFTVALPYADLTLQGVVGGVPVTVSDSAMPDPKIRLAFNLHGAPALPVEKFAGYRQRTIVGFSIEVTMPLGDYDETRRVNFGSNRWSLAPQIGFGHRIGRFTLEGALAGVLFTENDEYLVDNKLTQDPIGVVRANLIYHLRRPGTWLALGGLYLTGGETSLNGSKRSDLQSSSRAGVALSVPFARRHNLLFKYTRGVSTRIGANFDNYQVQYTLRF